MAEKEGMTDSAVAKYSYNVTLVPVTAIALSARSARLGVGGEMSIAASVTPQNANSIIRWESSAPSIADVDQSGAVRGVKAGKATITATVGKYVTELSITGVERLGGGKSATLKAGFEPLNATNKKLVWTSSDAIVAKVSSSGKVTAQKVAEVQDVVITATSVENPIIKCSHTITVTPRP